MANIVLQPASDGASKANLIKTVFNKVRLDDISFALAPRDRNALDLLSDTGSVSFWGAKPGEDGRNIRRWNRIAPGDSILFALGKERALIARVAYKLHNKPLAKDLWGTTETANGIEQTWEYMFAIDSLDEREYNKAALNAAIGRKPNADIREFTVLSAESSAAAVSFFGLATSRASPARPSSAPTMSRRKISKADIEKLDVLDSLSQKKRRIEQRLLREYLLPEDTGRCALCGRTFPIQFLVAAHIKARSACSDNEKRDIENVAMPNCRFGCDELFERGFISVDSMGQTRVSRVAPEVGPVRAYILEHLLDQVNPLWASNSLSRKYFAFHASNTFLS